MVGIARSTNQQRQSSLYPKLFYVSANLPSSGRVQCLPHEAASTLIDQAFVVCNVISISLSASLQIDSEPVRRHYATTLLIVWLVLREHV